MGERLPAIAKRFWPDLETMGENDRRHGIGNVSGFLYAAPLALAGLVWLVIITDLPLIRAEWPTLLLLFVLLGVFGRLRFFSFVETTSGAYADWQGSLVEVIAWSAALTFGPSAWWLSVPWALIDYASWWQRSPTAASRWSCARDCALSFAGVLARLIALVLYRRWNGAFPLSGLSLEQVLPAFYATFVWWLLSTVIWTPYLIYHTRSGILRGSSPGTYIRFWAAAMGWGALATPFSILAAGLHAQNGLGGYLFVVAGALLTSLLAQRLSQVAERSQQRSRELEKLEQLGRALLTCCPDASDLGKVLKEHVSTMFPYSLVEIHVYPDQTLMHHTTQEVYKPYGEPSVVPSVWDWLRGTPEARCFLPGETLPWDIDAGPIGNAVVIAPILDVECAEPLGGVYLSPNRHPKTAASLLPAVQSLAAQIASALHSAEIYAQTLAHQRVEQELALAGQVQASFLPDELPDVPGWQLAATLDPARETSGDFYDVFSLPNGQLGILIADVADKGMGAALYMAKSSTLIRTYAAQYGPQPELVLKAVNLRILADTRADLFVTVFYGVLEPDTGTLTYCNAGHNPPLLFCGRDGEEAQALGRTGMALGVAESEVWEQKTVQFEPGDVLVLYTDGVTDAQNAQEVFFGRERLLGAVQANMGRSARDMQEALVAQVRAFMGKAPHTKRDDITLMVVVRESTKT
jgi:serine phosphatase RsbU (regulator of sigma subunit)